MAKGKLFFVQLVCLVLASVSSAENSDFLSKDKILQIIRDAKTGKTTIASGFNVGSEKVLDLGTIGDKKLVSGFSVPASAREVLKFGKLPPIPPETTLFSKRGASLARLFGDNPAGDRPASRRVFTHGTTPAPEVDTIDSFY